MIRERHLTAVPARSTSKKWWLLAMVMIVAALSLFFFKKISIEHGEARAPSSDALTAESHPGMTSEQRPRDRTNGSRPTAPLQPAGDSENAQAEPEQPDLRTLPIREVALKYREGRFNAFFNEKKFFDELSGGGAERVTDLKAELQRTDDLATLPSDVSFMEDKPPVILERMAMIDMLKQLAKTDPAARDAIVSLVAMPVNSSLQAHVIKAVMGDKYDLLFGLAGIDANLAVETFSKLESAAVKSFLRPAVLTGLSEGGLPPDEVSRLTGNL
jgi:hypothetical protein